MSLPSITPASATVTPLPVHPPAPAAQSAAAAETQAAVEPVARSSASQNAPTDPAELRQAVDEVKTALGAVTDELTFSIDQDTGRTLVKIVDRETDEVIKQIPSEEMLQIAKALDKLQGLLVKLDV